MVDPKQARASTVRNLRRSTGHPKRKAPQVSFPLPAERKTPENPDRPEFCPPFETGDPMGWLEQATVGLGKLCAINEARCSRGIDSEVIAAIYLEREVRNNAELQAAWCQLPGWSKVKLKAPKPGKTERLLEEVFRYQWGVVRGDQDGYELRFRAVKHHYRRDLEPEAIVVRIHRSGGYKEAAKKIVPTSDLATEQEAPLVSIEPASVAARGSKPATASVAAAQDSSATCKVVFIDCMDDAVARQDNWVMWRVKSDWKQDPPVLVVDRVSQEDLT